MAPSCIRDEQHHAATASAPIVWANVYASSARRRGVEVDRSAQPPHDGIVGRGHHEDLSRSPGLLLPAQDHGLGQCHQLAEPPGACGRDVARPSERGVCARRDGHHDVVECAEDVDLPFGSGRESWRRRRATASG
jgi:hypothetical protein